MRVHSLAELYIALQKSWGPDTAYEGRRVRGLPDNQCKVTAMVVQDYFGGEVLVADMADGDKHFWNRLPDGTEVDLTSKQFEGGDGLTPALETGQVSKRGITRYRKLSNRVREAL